MIHCTSEYIALKIDREIERSANILLVSRSLEDAHYIRILSCWIFQRYSTENKFSMLCFD